MMWQLKLQGYLFIRNLFYQQAALQCAVPSFEHLFCCVFKNTNVNDITLTKYKSSCKFVKFVPL